MRLEAANTQIAWLFLALPASNSSISVNQLPKFGRPPKRGVTSVCPTPPNGIEPNSAAQRLHFSFDGSNWFRSARISALSRVNESR